MLHPELKEFLARLETVPATTSIEEKRRAWREFCLKNNHPRPAGMSVWNQTLPLPGREIALRWYIPEIEKPDPCVIYLHGGGWVLGDLDTQDTIAWGLARGARALRRGGGNRGGAERFAISRGRRPTGSAYRRRR